MLMFSGGEPRYPAETSTLQPAYVVTPGGAGRDILRASRVLGDYPLHRGVAQIGCLHLDLPPGDSDVALRLAGERSVREVFQAGSRACDAIFERMRRDCLALLRGRTGVRLRLFLITWTGGTTGAGLVIPVLAAFQRLRAELADHGVPVERWAILTLPVAGSDQPVLVLDRSAATLLSLEIASRAGVPVGGRRLTVPLAEYAFLIDEAGPPPWSVEAQRDYASDVLRKVAQTGRPGEAIRQSIRRQPRPDPSVESWVLQSIRFGSPTSNHRMRA
ncbi:MAG: hypothetical protein E6J41_05895 [Chloroflexi bacterium]|nr:MAG: hypothetical protein E6J41_05895 [Chloroflexota bacterium]